MKCPERRFVQPSDMTMDKHFRPDHMDQGPLPIDDLRFGLIYPSYEGDGRGLTASI